MNAKNLLDQLLGSGQSLLSNLPGNAAARERLEWEGVERDLGWKPTRL